MTEATNLDGWDFECIFAKGGKAFSYKVVAPNRQVFKQGGTFRTEVEAWDAGEALVRAFLSNPKSKNVAWWTTPVTRGVAV